ncbi:uncharacterized protein (DUF433 family) [Pedobacter sp. UYP30]|uniref:DUF433 domain-containing protein n=1 Tax=Pedobacter sp. UYP30 TaxID=1756400 RepID=UPI00339925FD
MNVKELITVDNDILGGQPVFKGTRVPVESLFDHLQVGVSLAKFLNEFPTVTKVQAIALLAIANKLVRPKDIGKLYATISARVPSVN